jgi:hypothetical protein
VSERLNVGDMVVVPGAPGRGVGRLERLLPPGAPPDTAQQARIFFYDHGQLEVFPLGEVAPAPPGVWSPGEPSS